MLSIIRPANRLKFISISAVSLLIIGGTVFLLRTHDDVPVLHSHFLEGIQSETVQTELAATKASQNISDAVAAIVPHHDVAERLIAHTLQTIAFANPKTIVLIGPDHPNAGTTTFTISDANWMWGPTLIETQHSVVSAMRTQTTVSVNNQQIQEEHSVLVPLPYISSVFPRARIVLLTVRSEYNPSLAKDMARHLDSLLKPDDLVVASVDFSHYKSLPEAQLEDDQSLALLNAYNDSTISEIHADSPMSIAIVQEFAALRSAKKHQLIDHSNSALLLNDITSPSTTSYITMVFSKE